MSCKALLKTSNALSSLSAAAAAAAGMQLVTCSLSLSVTTLRREQIKDGGGEVTNHFPSSYKDGLEKIMLRSSFQYQQQFYAQKWLL